MIRYGRTPAALLLTVLLVGTPTGVQAQDRDISLDRFEQEIQVRPDGTFEVQETLTVRFEGSWNGIERDLLDRLETPEGRRVRTRLRVESVTDADGRELEVERTGISGGTRLRIWVPGAQDAVRQVVVRYRVDRGLRFWTPELLEAGRAGPDAPVEPFDELYWNSTGHQWEMSIREALVRVRLPEGAGVLGAWGYTGREGSTEQAVEVDTGPSSASIRTTRPLSEGEGLTVSVAWEPGFVDRPTAADRAAGRLLALWPLALLPVGVVGMFLTWRAHGRDPDRRRIMVHYHPPEGLSPAEVGTLVDHKAELHDLTSTLVDLAVRGYVTIEEEEKSGVLARLSRRTEYTFHQRKPRSAWGDLRPHERRYLEGLFPPDKDSSELQPRNAGEFFGLVAAGFGAWREARRSGEPFDGESWTRDWLQSRRSEGGQKDGEEALASVPLSDLTNRFHTHMRPITNKIYDRLKARGLYDGRPDRARQTWAGAGVMLMVFGGFMTMGAAALSMPWILPHPAAVAGGVGGVGLIVLGFSPFMGVRTEKGVQVLEEILGFKQFLERVEAPQYARMITSPELFEEYLPYAMALQVEDKWAQAFQDIYRTPPEWYRGAAAGAGFRTTAFARQMRTFSGDAGRVMTSTPGGSGGSGAGGGGSSGGGGGGGGGRGF